MHEGDEIELLAEKPAAGGRMIARHDGQVVLLLGAIPGERVVARVERVERQLAFASTVRVLDPSPDRTPVAPADMLCGGCLYAHIAYPRQLVLKSEVVGDAFARLGRLPLEAPLEVAPSPPTGYRMRARLHARGTRLGSYREGTHDLCDMRVTGQLREDTIAAAERAVASLAAAGQPVTTVVVAENIEGDERVLHVTPAPGSALTEAAMEEARGAARLTGCSGRSADGVILTAGVPVVTDPLTVLTAGRVQSGILQRHAEAFFQANRFLLPSLVVAVLDAVPDEGDVLDLYAGVGLFSIALAAQGREGVVAVEGDRTSGADLQRNAASTGARVHVSIGSVEEFLRRWKGRPSRTVIVDPPRTGISRQAMLAVVAHGASRVIYVSCDPATMARDARRLVDGGYRLRSLRGFDLFPNTPHVEAVGVFDRT